MSRIQVASENSTPVELYYEDHGAGSRRQVVSPEPLVDVPLLMRAPELVDDGSEVA